MIEGVIRSKFPRITQQAQINIMNKVARCGSTLSGALKYFSMGSISSFAIAARRRGAPVKLCYAAPRIERIMPICTTAGIGHASV